MVQIVTRDDKVYITDNAEKDKDIEVNIGTKLVLDNYSPFVCDVIGLASTTTPTITVKVVESNHKDFQKNERILLTNSGEGIDAKSLDNTDKHPRIINYVKIYRRVEGTSPSPSEKDVFPLTSASEKWHKDDEHDSCEICTKKFDFFNRKHHCRKCGKVVCDACSPFEKEGNRVCSICNSPFASTISKSGGYKRRQSKRKRSLRRRHTTKRTNIRRRSKKNNKRTRKYRKSSHHR